MKNKKEFNIMKIFGLLLLLLMFSQSVYSQLNQVYNRRLYSFSPTSHKNIIPYSVRADNSGNAYVIGEQTSDSVIIVKYSPGGYILWKKAFTSFGGPYSSELDAEGNLYLLFRTSWTSIAFCKISPLGSLLWWTARSGVCIYPAGNEEWDYMKIGNGGIYIIAYSTDGTTKDYVVIKYNTSGQLIWQKNIGGISGVDDIPRAIEIDAGENVYVTGKGFNEYLDYFYTIKLNSSGTVLWSSKYYSNALSINSIDADKSGNVYICGTTGTNINNTYFTVIKYNSSGGIHWSKSLGGDKGDGARKIKVDTWGDIVVTGTIGNHIFTVKYNSAGTVLWTNGYSDYAGQNRDFSFGYAGEIYVIGTVYYYSSSYDAIILKYDRDGILKWTKIYNSPYLNYDVGQDIFTRVDRADGLVKLYFSVWSNNSSLDRDFVTIMYTEDIPSFSNFNKTNNNKPEKFVLRQNYPNPFNPQTKISYSLVEPVNVNITLYDIIGREVKILVNANQEAGEHEFILTSEGLSSGTYFYKIKAGSFEDIKKLSVVK